MASATRYTLSHSRLGTTIYRSTFDQKMTMTWDATRAVTEAEAVMAYELKAVGALWLERHEGEWIVMLKITGRQGDSYLCTTRDKAQPRRFVNLHKLMGFLDEKFPTIKQISLVR